MNSTRDAEADDRFLDRCLEEVLGGRRAPDLRALIRAASEQQKAEAAARVEQAARATANAPRRRIRPVWFGLAAALLVSVGLAAIWRMNAHPEQQIEPPIASVQDPHDRLRELLDRFHQVMPRDPEKLRDAAVRAHIAPTALPVLRELIALLHAHRDSLQETASVQEFEVYASALGDEEVRASLARRADSGELDAAILLATQAVITAASAAERSASLDELAVLLRRHQKTSPSVVRCLTACARLSEEEAEWLTEAILDPELARSLARAARRARNDPRNLIGQPLVLAGRLIGGDEFNTADWRGSVVLAWFWGSWCEPCLQDVEVIASAARKHANRGFEVVGIACDIDESKLTKTLAEHPEIAWPQLFDIERPGWHELAVACNVHTLPTLILIDRQGVVRSVDVENVLEPTLSRLLEE